MSADAIRIKLTQGKVALVSERDYPRVSLYRWCARRAPGGVFYAQCGRIKTSLHRFVMRAKKGQLVDHIDGNGLNNTRENLRFADYAQNAANWRPRASSRPGFFKGVYLDTDGRWAASLTFRGVFYRAEERFDTKIEAARAFDELSRKIHGKFACTNEDLGYYAELGLSEEEVIRRRVLARAGDHQ